MNRFLIPLTDTIASLEGTVADVPEGFGARLLYGLNFALIGISIVFVVLIILMLVIKLFELVFYTIPRKKSEAAAAKALSAPVPTEPVAEAEDESEIAAVIAAAVDAYFQNSAVNAVAKKKYQIKSFKRI